MLIIKNSERFLDVLFVANVKRKKFKGQVVIPDESFGVLEVDYLFDMPQHFVFCIPENEEAKIVVSKDLATFALNLPQPEPEPIETIQETEPEPVKKGRKAKKENE